MHSSMCVSLFLFSFFKNSKLPKLIHVYISILSQITPNTTLVITGNDRVNISLTWTSPDNNLNEITICGHLGSDIEAELRQLPLIVGKSHCEMEAMAFKVTINMFHS